jgi:hypothetical protein
MQIFAQVIAAIVGGFHWPLQVRTARAVERRLARLARN